MNTVSAGQVEALLEALRLVMSLHSNSTIVGNQHDEAFRRRCPLCMALAVPSHCEQERTAFPKVLNLECVHCGVRLDQEIDPDVTDEELAIGWLQAVVEEPDSFFPAGPQSTLAVAYDSRIEAGRGSQWRRH